MELSARGCGSFLSNSQAQTASETQQDVFLQLAPHEFSPIGLEAALISLFNPKGNHDVLCKPEAPGSRSETQQKPGTTPCLFHPGLNKQRSHAPGSLMEEASAAPQLS